MMNQRELRAYYEKKAKLREAVLTLEGLREYAARGVPGLDAEIAGMEQETQATAAELDAEGERVLSTLAAVEDTVCRVMMIMHFYRGLTWKEIGELCGLSLYAAQNRTLRAMRKAIPK